MKEEPSFLSHQKKCTQKCPFMNQSWLAPIQLAPNFRLNDKIQIKEWSSNKYAYMKY